MYVLLTYDKCAVLYLVSVAGEGLSKLSSSGHSYHCVLHVVRLEQRLQNLAGAQRVHVRVGQH